MSNETKLEDMKYNELKTLAKESGLDAAGTKEDLVARLKEAGITGSATNTGDSADTEPTEPVENPDQPATPVAVVERAENTKADKALRTDAAKMKAHLDSLPKVSIMIPFEVGENAETGKKIMFHVNVNGYTMDIPRGVYVEVPLQIADMIKERLESEGKIGNQWRIDRDANKQNALA